MEKNVGALDAYMRITCGLTMLGYGIMKKSVPIIALGSGKVAEGVTKFCPMLYLLGMDTKNITLEQLKNQPQNKPLFHK